MGTLSAPGTLKILVIAAENLDRIVTAGTQQPYYIIECGKQRSRSKPCLQHGTNPHWNTAHKFELLDETAAVAVIKDEMTKGIIAEGIIDLSRARLTGRDAATAQLRNLAGQPAGLLRFKLKFQAAAPAAAAGSLAPQASEGISDSAHHAGSYQRMIDAERQDSHEGAGMPYSRRPSETSSVQRRVSEAGSYRSSGSIEGRRSATPSGSLPYVTASLERGPSGNLRASQQSMARRPSGEEPDVVLASVTNKVSLAKQAMQQLTAELAELTGPGQTGPGHTQGSRRALSPGPRSTPHSAFAAATAQHMPSTGGGPDSRSSSRQRGLGLNVLGQPMQQPQQQQGQRDAAWGEYKHVWQQQRQQQYHQGMPESAPSYSDAEGWNPAMGYEAAGPVYHQQPYAGQRQFRVSTGSVTPSGTYTPAGMMSPSQMSPRAYANHSMMAGGVFQGGDGMPVSWPRLRGVFGDGVLSTEELLALYADNGAASEKKLVSLLEEALAAAHAEKVATEQELSNVKQAMAEVSKQHYLDAKRLKEMTLAATALSGDAAQAGRAGRSVTPSRSRYEGTPPASPLSAGGGLFSMVDTKPSRRHSRASIGDDLRSSSPMGRGLTVMTGREPSASRSASVPDTTAQHAELANLRAEHSRLQSASSALENEVAQLKIHKQRAQELEEELEHLKQQQADTRKQTQAAAVAVSAGGAAAAAVAAAELKALRDEHGRVRALAESLEEEVAELRQASKQLQNTQQQLEDLQAEHANVKDAFVTAQQQLEKMRQQQLEVKSAKSVSEWQDATEDFDTSSNGGSPMPAYKLQIQVHQLERQLAEQAAKNQTEAATRQELEAELERLQEQLDIQAGMAKQAEDNARAAEKKAAEQATIAAAARTEAAEVRANKESSSGKEAQLTQDLAVAREDLEAALSDKAELETALGLLDRNSKAQIQQLQADLVKAQEEASALREGSSDVATLQAQLTAAQEEASGLRNNSEEVEYLQSQLRRTLRQVVELQRQVQVLQQERPSEATAANTDHEAAMEAAIRAETDFLMQELVAAKMALAEVKEQQLITQRQLYKARESMKQQHLMTATAVN